MNGKRMLLHGAVALIFAWAGSTHAYASDWADMVSPALNDPLLAHPRVLNMGKVLPGDTQVHVCKSHWDALGAPLTLLDAVDFALCNNPQIRGAWVSIKVQAAQVGEARAAYLPSVNAGVSRLRQKTQNPEADASVNSEQTRDSRYTTLTWRLLDFGGRNANHRSALSLLDAALVGHDAAFQRTVGSVIGLYFEAQTAKAYGESKEKNERIAQRTLETALKRAMRGSGSESETLQAKTALAKAELERSRSIGQYEKALVGLGVAMGLGKQVLQIQGLSLNSVVPEDAQDLGQDLVTWLSLAQVQHPAIVAARFQVEAAKERLRATRSEGLPTLDFSQSEYVNGRPNQGMSTTQTKESVLGFSINVPLFDGFARTYKVLAGQAHIEAKEAELLDVETQVLGEVAKAYADGVMAFRNQESSSRLLLVAHEAMDSVQRKYDKGVADILDMLSVQAALADAEQERIRAMAEWHSARLRLLSNSGVIGIQRLIH